MSIQHKAILRYRIVPGTDATVYVEDGTKKVSLIALEIRLSAHTHNLRLTPDKARELHSVLHWCLKQSGEIE